MTRAKGSTRGKGPNKKVATKAPAKAAARGKGRGKGMGKSSAKGGKSAKGESAKGKKRDAELGLFPSFGDDEDPAVLLARSLGEGAFVAGLDEAGRGPLAGPVVAASCVLPVPLPEALKPLNDSKQLTHEEREALYPLILEHAIAWGVCVVEAERIDEINILRASLEAMARSLDSCERMLGERGQPSEIKGAVIDGNMKAPLPMRVTQRTVIGGDALSRPIMAASILAKVTRDRRMVEEHARYPQYGFDAHKGYGTPQHMKALDAHGPCPLHRRSFAPVRVALGLPELPVGTSSTTAAALALALEMEADLGLDLDGELDAVRAATDGASS